MAFVVPSNFRQLPQTWEMAQPFRIDATGAVGFDFDPVRWAQGHILALCLTKSGERVMRPTYGVGLYNYVFEYNDPLVEAQMVQAIQNGVAMWEPTITINSCSLVPQAPFSGIFEVSIAFSVGSLPTQYTVSFTLGGQGIEVQQ
jgi:phage baseplate assembly protein W